MLKIKKITIENFRGIKAPLVIDLFKNNSFTSALIYGRNGTGKSSIIDAWEWLNTFDISGLKREGVSATDYPHKSSGGDNCYISVEFNHTSINTAKVQFNKKKITTPTTTGEYDEFKSYSIYPNYLRYSDLQNFVFKSKTDKYKYLAKFFGLERFTKNQDDLQAALNKLSLSLTNLQNSVEQNIATITSITNSTTINENVIIQYINTIATKHKIALIGSLSEVEKIKKDIGQIIQSNPKTKEILEWKAIAAKQNLFYPITSVTDKIVEFEKVFADLKRDEESIKQLILSNLYELSIKVIPQLENKTICPVCDNTYDGDLLNHITQKHTALDKLNKNKISFETKKNELEKYFETLSKKISAIKDETNEQIKLSLQPFFENVNAIYQSLPEIIATIKKHLNDLSVISISSNTSISLIDGLIAKEAINKQIVTDKIKDLEKDETSKLLAEDFHNVSNLIIGYKNYLINKSKVDYLTTINSNLNSLFTHLTQHIQTEIQTIFSNISADVVDCFNALESSNQFIKNPEIILVADKDKAVELEIEFVTEKVKPAFKFMSESQVNSFGLAIFLSAVKHFNTEFKFFILDDVINSFDAYKRPKVSQLLASKFNDFQKLILTHDQVFSDTIQRDYPNWQRIKFTSWDYTNGPKYKLAKNYTEEIQCYLDDDLPITAGQTLGRYLEWTFGVINESMQTSMRYKIDNIYTLAEFYDPLIKRLKEKLKQANKKHKVVEMFEQFEQGTIFRNYCSHWKNETAPFTTQEIEDIFKKWIEIENMLYCKECVSFVHFTTSTGNDYIKCNCGNLNLKDNSLYN